MKNAAIIFAIALMGALTACNTPSQTTTVTPNTLSAKSAAPPTGAKRPKNIILMIGDGMGLTQLSAGMYMNGNKLAVEQFPVVGLHKSYPDDQGDLITDSAAGATAFSTGVKTYNAAIGVSVDSLPRETILEQAEKNGLATGLVVTCEIQHATPAAFIAHVKHRDEFENIALDFLKTDIDLFIGGGKKYFDRRKDNANLLKQFEQKGYYVSGVAKEDLERVALPKSNFIYLTAEDKPVPVAQGRDYLPFASGLACRFLQNRSPKGFFMMIEGSQIDWGGHANNSDYITSEVIDFDAAITQVLEFAKKDGNTLVIVTADHETGGYAIQKGSKMDKLVTKFTSDYHTGTMIPVFAYGPGAENFAGIYENTAIYTKMKQLFGF